MTVLPTVLPLSGLRVVDLTDQRGALVGAALADLGADVVLVEPPGGVGFRRAAPLHGEVGVRFVVSATNKRSITCDLDTDEGRERLVELLGCADVWLEDTQPGWLADRGLDPAEIRRRYPSLVVTSITDFGQYGPYRDWAATEQVHLALNSSLSRSGVPGRPPILPPAGLADAVAGIQAAWATLVAVWGSRQTGLGDRIDFSILEGVSHCIDPIRGSIGTAAAAWSDKAEPDPKADRDRPEARFYPIFPCADGFVRIAILSSRQWQGVFRWLGEPEEFADPKYDMTSERMVASRRLNPLIAALFAEEKADDLVAEGQRRGVPLAPVLALDAVMGADHFRERGSFTTTPVGGQEATIPAGYWIIDGTRFGARGAAPSVGQHQADIDWDQRAPRPVAPDAEARATAPLRGLRLIDLGRIVMGAEGGRLFADQGADVIKIESRAFPDGARVLGVKPNSAAAQRNKRGLGLDLRSPEGLRLFERLVEQADVVLTNFKPGTVESLGIGFERLRELNPGIVLSKSSAMGDWGPWTNWMGYGPLVRGASGLTMMWRDPDVDDGFADATTIFPDHFVGRVADIGILAWLIARESSGRGTVVEISQAEAILMSLSTMFLCTSLGDAGEPVYGAPWAVLPCAGDDEWCVITVATDEQWASLVDAIGRPAWALDASLATAPARVERRDEIHKLLGEWTAARTPHEVTEILQALRVPAAPMLRNEELLDDPHLLARRYFREFMQPTLDEPVITENGVAQFERRGDPELRPAPQHGEQTREICAELLGLTDAEVDALLAAGVLEDSLEAPAP